MSEEKLDHPFDDVALDAQAWIARGASVHFKWTCVGCGSRQTFEEPNKLYAEGKCEECGAITSLVDNGCNFLVISARPR